MFHVPEITRHRRRILEQGGEYIDSVIEGFDRGGLASGMQQIN